MKYINKILTSILIWTSFLLCSCGKDEIPLSYGTLENDPNYVIEVKSEQLSSDFFAKDLCAIAQDKTDTSSIDPTIINAAGVYALDDVSVLYSYQANERVNPASLTKLMTALLVFENCNLNDMVTVGDVKISEEGAQLFNLKEGDLISVRDLLYITLIHSGNDAALALAIYVAGSEEAFVDMMNERALELGATNTHFENPHGLTSENHYTTAYDLYLIFNSDIQYPEFQTIINTTTYTVNYAHSNGEAVSKDISSTNKYLTNVYDSPDIVTIVGGKTGSTSAAGKCLIIYATSVSGKPYICVIMGAGDEDTLYHYMTRLCNEVCN